MQNNTENLLINRPLLLARFDNDEEFLMEMLNMFVQEVETKLTQIKKDLTENNFDDIRLVAHSLKGITSTLTAFTMRDAVCEMEGAVKRNDIKMIPSFLDTIENEHRKLIRFLNN